MGSITPDGWIGFAGSLTGALLAGIIALVVVWRSNRSGREDTKAAIKAGEENTKKAIIAGKENTDAVIKAAREDLRRQEEISFSNELVHELVSYIQSILRYQASYAREDFEQADASYFTITMQLEARLKNCNYTNSFKNSLENIHYRNSNRGRISDIDFRQQTRELMNELTKIINIYLKEW